MNIVIRVGVQIFLDRVGWSRIGHGHVLLPNVVQLLPVLKLTYRRIGGENLLEILPCLFRHLGISNVAKHVVVYTFCQAV